MDSELRKLCNFCGSVTDKILLYYLPLQKGSSWLIFLDQSEALGGAIAPIASIVQWLDYG